MRRILFIAGVGPGILAVAAVVWFLGPLLVIADVAPMATAWALLLLILLM